MALPRREVVLCSNGSANSLALTNRNVLVEGRGALNRGLVGARSQVYVVGRSITGDCANRAAKLVCAGIVLNDVVFNERISSPAVNLESYSASSGRMTSRKFNVSKNC
jgi:hypothetical protein